MRLPVSSFFPLPLSDIDELNLDPARITELNEKDFSANCFFSVRPMWVMLNLYQQAPTGQFQRRIDSCITQETFQETFETTMGNTIIFYL